MQPTQTQMQTPPSKLPTVDDFIIALMAEKDLVISSQEVFAQVKQDLMDRLEDKINATILANVPEDKLEEFEKRLETNTADEVISFASTVIKNLNEKIASAMLEFRTIYLGN